MKFRSALVAVLFVVASFPIATSPVLGVLKLETDAGGPTDTTCGDDTDFKLLRMKWASTPIEVFFDTATIPENLLDAVKAGVDPWEAEEHPEGDLAVEVFTASDAKDGVTVKFGVIDGPLDILASTLITFNLRTKKVVQVTITFDSEENWQVLAIACGIPISQGISVEDVSVHEFGHALPTLDHAKGDALTMKQFYSGGEERTLATGDRLGIEERFGGDGDGNGGGGGGNGGRGPPCPPIC